MVYRIAYPQTYLNFVVVYSKSTDLCASCSFVGSPAYPKSYLVTQQPLEETVEDFWR